MGPDGASLVGSAVKGLPATAGDAAPLPDPGRPPGEENGSPLQCSHLSNPVDRGPWEGRHPQRRKELEAPWRLNSNNGGRPPAFSCESVRSGWRPSSHLVTVRTVSWLAEDGLGQSEKGKCPTPSDVVWQ